MPTYRFGKHPRKSDYRTLRFRDYLDPSMAVPLPPSAHNSLDIVTAKLKAPLATLFPMDGNDRYGDCTIAALAHALTVFQGLIGRWQVLPAAKVTQLYFKLTGGVDSGLVELDVLNYWRQNRIGGDNILAYVSVDPRNHVHVAQAISLFGGVYLGFQLQQDCLSDFEAKIPWTPGPLLNEGHAVFATGYDPAGVTVLTWGSTQQGTWDWWDETVDEAYALLPPEAKVPGFAPEFNWKQLRADLAAVAG